MSDLKIVVIVGMCGSGKTIIVEHITKHKIPKVYFGGIILSAMERAGIERTPDSERKFREDIRKQEGKDFVLRQVIQEIQQLVKAGQKHIVLDGLYSWTEYKILKQEFGKDLTVVSVVAPKAIRYERVGKRTERPFTLEKIRERDWAEIENLEKGGPIAIADYYLDNSSDIASLEAAVDSLMKEIGLYD